MLYKIKIFWLLSAARHAPITAFELSWAHAWKKALTPPAVSVLVEVAHERRLHALIG
jgi:hypothetical protein